MTNLKETNPYVGLVYLVDTLNNVQKIRMSTQNRVSQLARQDRRDSTAEYFHAQLQAIEDDLVKRIHPVIKGHPTWKWAGQVRGVGPENLAKVVGLIERVEDGTGRHGIECFATPSKLVRFAGLAVIDGRAERRIPGRKTHYNCELRTMLWRLGGSLIKSGGKFYQYYLKEKDYITTRCREQCIEVRATPTGKWCPECQKEVAVKTAEWCPDCESALAKKDEPGGTMHSGHVHASAQRRMLRMFVIQLDTAWRQELGLPTRQPYPIEHLGHSKVLTPADFIGADRVARTRSADRLPALAGASNKEVDEDAF